MASIVTRPPYWLVTALEWPAAAERYAECAFAIAPSIVPRGTLSPAAHAIFDLADTVARTQGERVVLFSDLARKLQTDGREWHEIGVPSWEDTVEELINAPIPGLYLTLSEYAHFLLCTANANDTFVYGHDESVGNIHGTDHSDMKNSLNTMLSADWPAYIQQLKDAGQIRVAE